MNFVLCSLLQCVWQHCSRLCKARQLSPSFVLTFSSSNLSTGVLIPFFLPQNISLCNFPNCIILPFLLDINSPFPEQRVMFPNSFTFPCGKTALYLQLYRWHLSKEEKQRSQPRDHWNGFRTVQTPGSQGYLQSVFWQLLLETFAVNFPQQTGPLGRRLFTERWFVLAMSNHTSFRKHEQDFYFSETCPCLASLLDCGLESVSLYSTGRYSVSS